MAFVNPWILLIGAAAAALPVLIHWLTRPRQIVLPLSTVRFVIQAVEERRTRRRLRDFLILAARTAAVRASGRGHRAAADRPPATTTGRRRAPAVRLVILDVSQSMAARSGGVQSIERAGPAAAAAFRVSARAGGQPASVWRKRARGLRPPLDQLRSDSRRPGKGRAAPRASERSSRLERRGRDARAAPAASEARARRTVARSSSSATFSGPSGRRLIFRSSRVTPRSGSNRSRPRKPRPTWRCWASLAPAEPKWAGR